MSGPDLTRLILVVNIIGLAIYDVAALWWWGPPATISVVAYETSRSHPLLPLVVGLLLGHLFFPLYSK